MLHLINVAISQAKLNRFASTHPHVLSALLMVGAPVGILLAVTLITFGVMLPLSFLLGWL